MTHPTLRRRLDEQAELIDRVRGWAPSLAARVPVVAVVVFGSVARGDFNKGSDIDVLVVASDLPKRALDRLQLLDADRPPGVQLVAWTPNELAERREHNDPIVRECDSVGVSVHGALPV